MYHTPKISVLIPSFRYARYLPEAIESVLAQDFSDIEILISDDASGDGSREVMLAYAARDPRIRCVVQEKNLGMVGNWNWCLQQARGTYIKFLFGDDRLATPRALRQLHDMLERNPLANIAVSARRLIDADSNLIGQWDDLKQDGLHSGHELGRSCLLQMRNLIGEPSAVMFRASAVSQLFDLRYRQIVDLEMWLHLLCRGDLVYTRDLLCEFRCHEAQATVANSRLSLGFSEHALLLKDYLGDFLPEGVCLSEQEQRGLFATLHYVRKSSSACAKELVDSLAPRLGSWVYAGYWLRYHLSRPWVNLRLSVHKRLSPRKLEWSFASGWRLHSGAFE